MIVKSHTSADFCLQRLFCFLSHHLPEVVGQHTDPDVFAYRHLRERPRHLVRPGNAELHTLVSGVTRDRFPFEKDLTGIRSELVHDQVEHGRLAGTVGSDQADSLAFADVKTQPVHRAQAAEGPGQVPNLEQISHFENPGVV